jgi:cytochrome c peroxidase
MNRKLYILLAIPTTLIAIYAFPNGPSYLSARVQQLIRERKIVPMDQVKGKQDKPASLDEIELGKILFSDKILSRNKNISCASCHIPEKGFSNGSRFSNGTAGNELKRHVPHLYNLSLNRSFFWDGRARSLEEQLSLVLTSKDELDMNFKELVERLKSSEFYMNQFASVYPEQGITKQSITKAIVAFERSLVTKPGPYDNFLTGDSSALTPKQKKGLELFAGKANCIACHHGANLTDNTFHNVGVLTDDLGRHKIDKVGMSKEFESTPYPFFSMFKAFKTPSLRNVSMTAPYFHDGSKSSLQEVVDFYNKGGENPDPTGVAREIKPLNLDDEEKEALIEFLNALSSDYKQGLN